MDVILKEKINRNFKKNILQTILIYGRRRVGKSELIKQSLREYNGRSIYYECKQTTEANNVNSLSVLLGEIFHFPTLAFQSMEMLLEYLFSVAKEESLT